MDEALANRFAQELADAIAAAVAEDPRVEACRTRARASGVELRVTLEAVVAFATPGDAADPMRVAVKPGAAAPPRRDAMTAADRRFLRSLRIAAGTAAAE